MNFSVGRRGTQRRPRICAVPSNAERARFPLGGFSRVPPWKPGRSEVARSGREGVWEKGIHPQDLASLLPPHWPLSFRARDRARRLFAFSPLPSPCLGRPPTPCPTPGAQAALGPHLSSGSRDTRERDALSIRGAGARESPPGVRRGHALPGPGARQRGFPARRGEPAPFYSRRREASPSPRLGPPPPCPAPPRGDQARARAKGPWPRALCAQPSSRLFIAPRPGRARLASSGWKSGRGPARTALGGECSWSRRQPGDQGQGERRGARSELQHTVRARSTLPSRAGRRLSFSRGSEKEQGLHSSGRDRVLSGSFPAPVCRREPAAPSPPLQAGLQRETRRHALPPLLLLLDARPSAAARALLPKRWNRAPPARGACGGSARARNCGEPRGASWGTCERPGESARDKNCRAWCAYSP